MKKLLLIASVALVVSLAGCVGWAHWGSSDNHDPRQDQNQNQHYNDHAND